MEALLKLGFSQSEIDIYKVMLRVSPITVLQLSTITGKPRSTVHHATEKLKQRGLVVETLASNKRRLLAEPPEKIQLIIKKEEFKLVDKSKELENIKKEISDFILQAIPAEKVSDEPNIRYIKGIEPIRLLYDEILQADEVKTYANIADILDYFPENHLKFKSAAEKGSKIWDLLLYDEVAVLKSSFYHDTPTYYVKFFPANFKLKPMDYLIWDDNIAIINTGAIPNAVIIKDKLHADNARSLYDLLWSFLPEIDE